MAIAIRNRIKKSEIIIIIIIIHSYDNPGPSSHKSKNHESIKLACSNMQSLNIFFLYLMEMQIKIIFKTLQVSISLFSNQ